MFVDEAAGQVVFLRPDDSTETSPTLELTDSIVSITSLGTDTAVMVDPDGDVFVATPDDAAPVRSEVTDATGEPAELVLQQPGPEADHVVAATTDGRLVAVPLAGGESTPIAQLPGCRADGADRPRRVRVRRVHRAADVRPVVRDG